MFIQVWYFLTLTLTSLLMGTSFAHTLEMPAKMNVNGQLWRAIAIWNTRTSLVLCCI